MPHEHPSYSMYSHGANYWDLEQIATPANPAAGARRLFVDSADGKLKVRTPGGSSVSLEEQGGGGGEAFPVGSVFIAVVSTNPATLLGYGTWAAFGAGRVLVGLDAADPDFDTVEEIGGAKTHTLTEAEIPAHTHTQDAPTSASGGSRRFATDTNASGSVSDGTTGSTGGGGAHNNLQPYIVVYMWKRTA